MYYFFHSNASLQKSWIGPEVRGTVGLPWPTSLDSFNPQLPQNNFNTVTENLSRRPSQDNSYSYSRYPYSNSVNCEPNSRTATNSSNSGSNGNIYQTNSSLNSETLLNYPGTPSQHQRSTPLRTSSNNGIDQSNGNINSSNNNSSYETLSRQHHQQIQQHQQLLQHQQQQQQLRREQSNASWNKLNGGNFQTKYNSQSLMAETPSSDCSKQKLLIGSSNSSSTSSVLSNSNISCSRSRSTLSVAEQNSSVSSMSYHNQPQSLSSSSKMSTSSSTQSHLLLVNSASAGGSSISCNSGNDLKWSNDDSSTNTGQIQLPTVNSTKWGPLYLHKSSSDVENNVSIKNKTALYLYCFIYLQIYLERLCSKFI